MFKILVIFIFLLIATPLEAKTIVSIYSWSPWVYTNRDRALFIRINYKDYRHKEYYLNYDPSVSDYDFNERVKFVWSEVKKIVPDVILVYNSKAFSSLYKQYILPAKLQNTIFYKVPDYVFYANEFTVLDNSMLHGTVIVNNLPEVITEINSLGYNLYNIYVFWNPKSSRDDKALQAIKKITSNSLYAVEDYKISNTGDLHKALTTIKSKPQGIALFIATDALDLDTNKAINIGKLAHTIRSYNARNHLEIAMYRSLAAEGLAVSVSFNINQADNVNIDYIDNKMLLDLVHTNKRYVHKFSDKISVDKSRLQSLGFEKILLLKNLDFGAIYD